MPLPPSVQNPTDNLAANRPSQGQGNDVPADASTNAKQHDKWYRNMYQQKPHERVLRVIFTQITARDTDNKSQHYQSNSG